jgi:hypothetical protein
MPEKPLTSLLSPNSNLRSKVASLDSAIDTLRANGMESQANMLYSNLQQAIANKDIDNLKAYSGQLMALNTKNLTVPAEARTPKDEAARSIEQLISVADSRNIVIPPADLAAAANAFASKDQRAASALANEISELVNNRIKIQDEEDKEQIELNDGSIAVVGLKSRSRYDNTGNIIPFGNQNAQIFRSVVSEAYSPQSKEIMAAMGGGNDLVGASAIGAPMQKQPDIGANPEAYAAMQKSPEPALDPIERNTRANERARLLYESGDRIGALNTLRALRAEDIYGDITDETLDSYFGKSSATVPSQDIEKSPSVDFFDSLTTEQKKKYLDTLSPEARKNLLDQRVNRK